MNRAGVDPWVELSAHDTTAVRKKTYRRVVQDRPDVAILDLIEWIDGLDAVVEQLMENKGNTRASRQLVQSKVVGATVDGCPEVRTKVCDDREDNTRCVGVAVDTTERLKLGLELLELRCNTCFDVGERSADMMHQDLGTCYFRDIAVNIGYIPC